MKSHDRKKHLTLALAIGLLLGCQFAHAATITVDSSGDTIAVDGQVTLREAITSANNNAHVNSDVTALRVNPYGSDLINISFNTVTTITAAGIDLPEILDDLTIDGGSKTIIDSTAPYSNFRLGTFKIATGVTTTFANLTIRLGNSGGCIENLGNNLTVNNCIIDGYSTTITTQGIRDMVQTANPSTITLTNSTFTRCGQGVISEYNDVVAKQSTFYNNTNGLQCLGGNTSLTNCTFTGNSFRGIFLIDAFCQAVNCTIAGNNTGIAAFGGSSILLQNTIITDSSLGSSPTLLGNNITSGNPLLGPLANNGGPTLTMLPLVGSPAIDQAIIVSGSPILTIDQRGFTRPMDNPGIANAPGGNGSDIGAVEVTAANQIFINSVTQMEFNATSTKVYFTVSLLNHATAPVSVSWASANGTAIAPNDYVAGNGVLSFATGQRSKTIGVRVKGNTLTEPHEDFHVNLSNASGAVIAVGQGTCTIINDD